MFLLLTSTSTKWRKWYFRIWPINFGTYDPYDIHDKLYGQFPDLLIVFCEKSENNRTRNSMMDLFQYTKLGAKYRVLSKLDPAVFKYLFWSEDLWRHRYDSPEKIFEKETLGAKVYRPYSKISFPSLCRCVGQ